MKKYKKPYVPWEERRKSGDYTADKRRQIAGDVERLAREGKTNREIAQELGIKMWLICEIRRDRGIPNENKTYAVYDDDEMLVIGTARECAEALGRSRNYVYQLVCHTKKGDMKHKIGIRIEEDDGERETEEEGLHHDKAG